jgi:uncharacterized protein (TIRG00374 family)
MTRPSGRALGWSLRLVATAALLAMVVWQVDLQELGRGLAGVQPGPLAAGIAAVFLMRVCAAARMVVVLRRHGLDVSLPAVFGINLRTAFVSFFLPGHLAGGVVRWHLLTRQGASGADALTAIGFDRLNEFSVMILTGLVCAVLSVHPGTPAIVPLLLGATFVGLAVVQAVVLSERFVDVARRALAGVGVFRWRVVSRVFEKLAISGSAFRSLPIASRARIWSWSVVSNLAGLLSYYCLALAVGLVLGVAELGWVRSAVTALGMLPLTLSGLGVREGAMIVLLSGYGVAPAMAVAFSLLIFARAVAIALAGGLLCGIDLLTGRSWLAAAKAPSAP